MTKELKLIQFWKKYLLWLICPGKKVLLWKYMMKKFKVYIVTYKRNEILNDTLKNLFESDFSEIQNTEVNIINNHTEFYLDEEFIGKVKVLHNVLRPNRSNGNLAENWNQALLHGFKDLNNPDSEYVVTMQNSGKPYPFCFDAV